jgi:DNA polymerase-4
MQGHTRTLFETGDARAPLNAAIDRINRRLGKNTVYYGGAHGALDYAPLRIAFTRIPDVALEEGETCDELLPGEDELAKFRPPRENHDG